jgi:hypothetical protein
VGCTNVSREVPGERKCVIRDYDENRVIKLRRMRRVGHVAHIREMRNAFNNFSRKTLREETAWNT